MRVLRIIVRDFLSYADLDLDLSDVNMAAIVGKNGAGKSTLLDAITFALYGKGRYRTLSKFVREGAETAIVRLDFLSGGVPYTIERTVTVTGTGNSLRFLRGTDSVWSNERKHTAPETQALIIRKIGMTYEALKAGPLMRQNESGSFMAMDPKDRKDLLTNLLGLEKYETYAVEAKTAATDYQKQARDAEVQLAELQLIVDQEAEVQQDLQVARYELMTAQSEHERMAEELATLREKRAALAEKARHADSLRQTVTMLSTRITTDERERDRMLKQVSAAHQMTDAPEPTFAELPDVSDVEIARRQAALEDEQKRQGAIRNIESQKVAAEAEFRHLSTQHGIVDTVPCGGQGIYATCRFLSTAPSKAEVAEAESRLSGLLTRINDMPKPRDLGELTVAYTSLVAQKAEVEKQLLRQEAAVEQWRLKRDQAVATVRSGQDAMRRITAQIDRDKDVYARSVEQLAQVDTESTEVHTVEVAIASLTNSIDETKRSIDIVYQPAVRRGEEQLTRIAVAKEQSAPLRKTIKESGEKSQLYGVLAKAFHRNGIPTLILEGSIPLIQDYANEVLSRMPDAYAVRLLTQRETKGGLADRLSIVVETKSRERDYEGLSGGEAFRIDFALRVALSKLSASLAGTKWETYIIDEGFGSQDEDGVDAMLESIAAIKQEFGLVLTISHQKAVVDRAESLVEVSRDEETSYAVIR